MSKRRRPVDEQMARNDARVRDFYWFLEHGFWSSPWRSIRLEKRIERACIRHDSRIAKRARKLRRSRTYASRRASK